jgi:transcriptional regulator with XRE-family HTH domain
MDPQELRERRLRLGLSQPALAELLSVAPMTVSRWERGVQAIAAPGMLHWALRGLERSRRRPPAVRGRGPAY